MLLFSGYCLKLSHFVVIEKDSVWSNLVENFVILFITTFFFNIIFSWQFPGAEMNDTHNFIYAF